MIGAGVDPGQCDLTGSGTPVRPAPGRDVARSVLEISCDLRQMRRRRGVFADPDRLHRRARPGLLGCSSPAWTSSENTGEDVTFDAGAAPTCRPSAATSTRWSSPRRRSPVRPRLPELPAAQPLRRCADRQPASTRDARVRPELDTIVVPTRTTRSRHARGPAAHIHDGDVFDADQRSPSMITAFARVDGRLASSPTSRCTCPVRWATRRRQGRRFHPVLPVQPAAGLRRRHPGAMLRGGGEGRHHQARGRFFNAIVEPTPKVHHRAQGARRWLRGDGSEAAVRRPELRLAHRADRGDRRRGWRSCWSSASRIPPRRRCRRSAPTSSRGTTSTWPLPWIAAERGYIDGVNEPHQTRLLLRKSPHLLVITESEEGAAQARPDAAVTDDDGGGGGRRPQRAGRRCRLWPGRRPGHVLEAADRVGGGVRSGKRSSPAFWCTITARPSTRWPSAHPSWRTGPRAARIALARPKSTAHTRFSDGGADCCTACRGHCRGSGRRRCAAGPARRPGQPVRPAERDILGPSCCTCRNTHWPLPGLACRRCCRSRRLTRAFRTPAAAALFAASPRTHLPPTAAADDLGDRPGHRDLGTGTAGLSPKAARRRSPMRWPRHWPTSGGTSTAWIDAAAQLPRADAFAFRPGAHRGGRHPR